MTSQTEPQPPSRRPRRRLALSAALLALFQTVAAARALVTPPELAAVVSLPLAFAFVGAALWALAFGVVAVWLWRGSARAVFRYGFALVVFIIYSAARLAFFARADYDRQRLPVVLVVAVCVTGGLGLWLFWKRRSHRDTEKMHGSGSEPQRQD